MSSKRSFKKIEKQYIFFFNFEKKDLLYHLKLNPIFKSTCRQWCVTGAKLKQTKFSNKLNTVYSIKLIKKILNQK